MANAQRSNIAVGAPPNFMLPPYQAGWTGHLASTSCKANSRGFPKSDGHGNIWPGIRGVLPAGE